MDLCRSCGSANVVVAEGSGPHKAGLKCQDCGQHRWLMDSNGKGAIWKNDRKRNDSDADFTGTFTDAEGREYWVNAWKREEGANPRAPALRFNVKLKD